MRWQEQVIVKEKNHLEDLDLDGRIILKDTFKKQNGSVDWIDLAQNRGRVAGFCEHGNEPLCYVKYWDFFFD